MTFTIRETCRLCDAKLPDERVLDLGETPLANALVGPEWVTIEHMDRAAKAFGGRSPEFTAPLYLKACSACGHVQLPVVVDPRLLFPADYPYQSATGASMREHLERMASDLVRSLHPGEPLIDPVDSVVVEIGSNDGFLLRRIAEHGVRVVGVDPAGRPAHNGVLTVPAFFDRHVAESVVSATGEADIIVANNVFAHADDLHEIVEGVKVLLAPEGRFVFEVGYLPSVLRLNNFPTVYHEHLSYHHVEPLRKLFHRHGLFLYDAKEVMTQGGSIRCFVGRPNTVHTLQYPTYQDDLRGLPTWQSRVDYAANAFASEVTRLKMAGKTIAGYGCSAKSTTLLHVAGIGRETIDFICDDAPTKQGKFSPGKHLPIVPGSWLEEKQPDYCVSLSGNFSEAFKAAHPLYKGEWLEPDLGGGA